MGHRPRPGRTAAARDRILTIVAMPYQADGSGYYRMYLPFKHLTANSRHIFGIPAPGVKVGLPGPADLEDVDVLVTQRPAFKFGMRQFDRLAGHVARVHEVDDDLLTTETSNLPFTTDPRAVESVRYCLRRAEMVTVSTPYLAELYAPFNSNIVVLPNYVKAGLLDLPRKRRDRVTIGWQGGTSHLIDLCAIQDPLTGVLDANPDADMHWIGVDYSPLVRRQCRFTPWSEDVGDYYKTIDFDIAIAPLADAGNMWDVPFNRSKSHLKCLEAAARGIPVVAQDCEPYREFVRDGETGYLVRTGEQWRARLTELIHDSAAREEMGAKARALAAGYTIEEHWAKWEAAYQSCV